MNRRTFLLSVTVAAIVAALAACGDSSGVSVGSDPPTPPTSPATSPSTSPATTPPTSPAAIPHPTGPNDAVLQIQFEGGFVPFGFDFASIPSLVVSGDGRIFTPAPASTPAPGELMENILVRQTNEDGLQNLLGVAKQAGLLATPPEYPDRHDVADAPNTVLTINAAGGTFVHSAYALGIGDPETGARKTLLDTIARFSDVESIVGAGNIDTGVSFIPTAYRLKARIIDPLSAAQDPAPTIVGWPAAAGVSLAAAGACARVDSAAIGRLFLDAMQNTFFKDGDVVYQLSVRGVLPGDPAC